MHQQLAFDLRVARRQAGLTQADCAYLLDLTKQQVSNLELGKRPISIRELCGYAVILGSPLPDLLAGQLRTAGLSIKDQLATLPQPKARWSATFNRHHTLDRLGNRLEELTLDLHGAA